MPLITVTTRCPICDESHALDVDADAYARWTRREVLIQDAFPDLPPAQRELLQTGIDDTCFKRLFAD
jgi:hypothetical protein